MAQNALECQAVLRGVGSIPRVMNLIAHAKHYISTKVPQQPWSTTPNNRIRPEDICIACTNALNWLAKDEHNRRALISLNAIPVLCELLRHRVPMTETDLNEFQKSFGKSVKEEAQLAENVCGAAAHVLLSLRVDDQARQLMENYRVNDTLDQFQRWLDSTGNGNNRGNGNQASSQQHQQTQPQPAAPVQPPQAQHQPPPPPQQQQVPNPQVRHEQMHRQAQQQQYGHPATAQQQQHHPGYHPYSSQPARQPPHPSSQQQQPRGGYHYPPQQQHGAAQPPSTQTPGPIHPAAAYAQQPQQQQPQVHPQAAYGSNPNAQVPQHALPPRQQPQQQQGYQPQQGYNHQYPPNSGAPPPQGGYRY